MQCSCQNTRIVWTRIARDGEPLAGGMRFLRRQCLDCGALGANSLPQHHARADTPDVDVEAVRRWNKNQKEYFERRRMSFVKEQSSIQGEIREQYENYLQTDAWRLKRLKILTRADWVCEGCGENTATQVHHLSYAHLGDELLWELKAVCAECHARCHPEKQNKVA